MITLEQIKAARMLLNLKQSDLAKKAGVSIATLNNIERGAQTDPKISTMQCIYKALEREGIVFINDAIQGIGVARKSNHMAGHIAHILIIDDSKADRTLYKTWLSQTSGGKNYRIHEADNARSGFDAFLAIKPQCILLDFKLYGMDGFQLLASLKREQAKLPPIIFITGMHNANMEENARSVGVHTYLNKQTLRKEDLCHAVEQALRR